MNDASFMSPEQGLLSLPRNGETLRFSWVRGSEGRFRMSLEGMGTETESGQSLGRRISAFLSLMEHEGVAFADRSAPETGADSGREETVWMEVTPREHAFPAGGDGVIGFGGEDENEARIRLPALGPVRAPDLSGYFLDLVAGAETVNEICLSFTRCELTPERERVLDRNLRLPFPDVLALTGRNAQPDDLQCFMALWLVRRGGWRLRILARVSAVDDMIRQKENALELDARLQRGGVVLANLDKGLLGHTGSRLLGTLLTTELFSVGLRRSRMDATDRAPVNVYIDEFQNFVSPTVGDMFAEARKFGLRLHVANQTLGQLSQSRDNLTHSVLGNVGNQIFFRVGVQDTGDLEPFFHPFTRGRMQELPNYRAFVRLMTCNGPLRPFIMQTLPVK